MNVFREITSSPTTQQKELPIGQEKQNSFNLKTAHILPSLRGLFQTAKEINSLRNTFPELLKLTTLKVIFRGADGVGLTH